MIYTVKLFTILHRMFTLHRMSILGFDQHIEEYLKTLNKKIEEHNHQVDVIPQENLF